MRLDGKVALITGGSKGIGKGIAKLFSNEGAKVIIVSKNQNLLKKTSLELRNVIPITANIKNENEVQEAVNKTVNEFGKIDILVNNAGIFPKFQPLHKISESEWNEIIDVNLTGQFRFTKAVLPHMFENGGSIINISSVAGLKAFENFQADAYSASKAALIQLTKVWAIEYAKYKIRVNCICAAVVDTDLTKENWLSSSEQRQKTSLEHPLGRIGTVEDMAKTALYFASDDASWTTGAILSVDGGVSVK